MIAGTASGTGKTTTALAVMAALRERGMSVQPFKCGPDFLDTGHHTAVCERAARNLDTWLLGGESNRRLFADATRGADAAVIEGMMGLFDGVRGRGEAGSSAEIAKLLHVPVVLVIDASKSARSVAAIVKGFESFDPQVAFAGVVMNGVNSEIHFGLLRDAIASATSLPVLGRIPCEPALAIPERHLGLQAAEELSVWDERRKAFAEAARQHLDLDLLISRMGHSSLRDSVPPAKAKACHVRYGVARDAAFSFYYEDNLDLLQQCGAEIVPFSPLADTHLAEDLDGLYLGGGYPELHVQQLSANRSMLADIRRFAESGRPVYAECGGMLYLGRSLTTLDGVSMPMAGVLPLSFQMTERLVNFGYVDVEFTEDCLLGRRGTFVRGHSFHHSCQAGEQQPLSRAYRLRYSLSGRSESEGFMRGCVLASYVHLHFRANISMAEELVQHAQAARTGREVRP